MVFWGTVGIALLVLIAGVEWLDRKRRGAPLGRRDGKHHEAVGEAHLQSWRSHRGDGSGKL